MKEPVHAEIRYYSGGRVGFVRHEAPPKPVEASHGSKDDRHIEHPKLGQVDTGGDRFGAILKASGRLHALQSGTRFAFEMRQRCERTRLAPVNYPDDDPWIFGGQ
jgi:hypothetical protein